MFLLNNAPITEVKNLDYTFWLPVLISIIAFIWGCIAFVWGLINSRSLEKLKTQNEKQIHVHKERFDKEFEAYKMLWVKVCDFETNIIYTYNTIKRTLESISEKDIKFENESLMVSIQDHSIRILKAIEIEKPFYDKSVYNKLELLKKFIDKNSLADVNKWNNRYLKEFLVEELIKNETRKIAEEISESIRKRISSIEIV